MADKKNNSPRQLSRDDLLLLFEFYLEITRKTVHQAIQTGQIKEPGAYRYNPQTARYEKLNQDDDDEK